MWEDLRYKGAVKSPTRHPARRIRDGLAGSAQRSKPQQLTRHHPWTFPRGLAKTQPLGCGSNTRLQWRRGTPAHTAGSETDEQALNVLGLAVERRWPEIDDLEKRGRC